MTGVINVERKGDYWNAYNEDAKALSRACQITATVENGMPSAGFPDHSVGDYIASVHAAGMDLKFNRPIRA